MDVNVYSYPHGDPLLIDKIVNEFLSQGKFDKLRKECMSDADTKPAYQNLQQRVEGTVTQFLSKQVWKPDLNKNQLRDSLRKHILDSNFFDAGINRIVDQVVNPNVLGTVFLPEVEEVVYNYLSIPKPTDHFQKKVSSSNSEIENLKPPGSENYNLNDDFEIKIKEENSKSDFNEKENMTDLKFSAQQKLENAEKMEEVSLENQKDFGKMDIVSDESQESCSQLGVEKLRINEMEPSNSLDSDNSLRLEINEKSMSESRESDDSIMNQMSPISQGRLTPELSETDKPYEDDAENSKMLNFIGRIPKIKPEDLESARMSNKNEGIISERKNANSSDESNDREREKDKVKEKDNDRERKSREDRDSKSDKSRDKFYSSKKNYSSTTFSSSKDKSSKYHKRSHQSRHRDLDFKDDSHSKKKKSEEKKKNKNTDDHGKERNKKDGRRSTDRDSHERDKSGGSRNKMENKNKEREQDGEEIKREKSQNNESEFDKDVEVMHGEAEEVVLEMNEDWIPSDGEQILLVNENWICSEEFTVEKTNKCEENVEIVNKETSNESVVDKILDIKKLVQERALTKVKFPKLIDDFYVKFNSTGFKYFEEWEKCKLDCEEEFKDFVDEAENDLTLISDDGSDPESDFNFEEENAKIITNMFKGLGNFKNSIIFDPLTSEFYKWTNSKHYEKYHNKDKKKKWRRCVVEKNESDDSVKENINRVKVNSSDFDFQREKNKENLAKEKKALHLKLLNRYKRKALRQGKPRKRQKKKPLHEGIKEKNRNSNHHLTYGNYQLNNKTRIFESETYRETDATFSNSNISEITSRLTEKTKNNSNKFNFSGKQNDNDEVSVKNATATNDYDDVKSEEYLRSEKDVSKSVNNRKSEVDDKLVEALLVGSEDINILEIQKHGKEESRGLEMTDLNSKNHHYQNSKGENDKNNAYNQQKCSLPLSPESDDCVSLKDVVVVAPKKQCKRNYCQKYDSLDLYKPRPVLNSSRSRNLYYL
ncbi:coiled-coil domain-containing protein, putative [Pediculus humanus corporis]|uniref:Coiled-coil domain-containing protein, putative n=1 Tax=Pediculus humanus subsp. corporis TaxID=121224 RepID=E0VUW8_PEDHC|nr:coiled-coil domain-containing protein, putative [Pediculus humanus corporis]EEB17174.1 coiled-coil domain-containing protein, putative [Pediculus humanus corporis]